MSKPHPELVDRTPLDVARTELGARRVEALLDKLFYGLPRLTMIEVSAPELVRWDMRLFRSLPDH